MKKSKSTKREKIFFLITLVSVIVAVGAIVHAGTATQGHPWSEITCSNCIGASDINSSEVQKRVSGYCSSGYSIRKIYSDGTVDCEYDTDTTKSREAVQDDVGAMAGSHLSYDDANNKLNAAWPSLTVKRYNAFRDCDVSGGGSTFATSDDLYPNEWFCAVSMVELGEVDGTLEQARCEAIVDPESGKWVLRAYLNNCGDQWASCQFACLKLV